MNDEEFMRLALEEARMGGEAGEVPVGAVLVSEGKVIARAHNRIESTGDPSAHAEVLCLRLGAEVLGDWRLVGATLYCTLEPCPMCAGAMIQARVSRLVWGAPDLRQGAHGSWVNLLDQPHPIHKLSVTSGVLAAESSELIRSFFRARREDGKVPERVQGLKKTFDDLVSLQQEKVKKCAFEIVPHLTDDDLLQPNDFPSLENHPHFRYEEGVLEGLLSARMAWASLQNKIYNS